MADELASVKAQYAAFRKEIEVAMVRATEQAASLLLQEMEHLTGLIDHDLAELARMEHPYRPAVPAGTPHPDYLVHRQGGELQEGLSRRPVRILGKLVSVEIHSAARHTWYVLLGTRKMRPRDFVTSAMINKDREIGAIYAAQHRSVHSEGQPGGFRADRIDVSGHVRKPQLPSG